MNTERADKAKPKILNRKGHEETKGDTKKTRSTEILPRMNMDSSTKKHGSVCSRVYDQQLFNFQ
jgi:hypothetical protein